MLSAPQPLHVTAMVKNPSTLHLVPSETVEHPEGLAQQIVIRSVITQGQKAVHLEKALQNLQTSCPIPHTFQITLQFNMNCHSRSSGIMQAF